MVDPGYGVMRVENDRGFVDFRRSSGGTVEILDIHVDSEHRGKDVGRRLVEAVFANCGSAHLVFAITRADNLIAQQFYERLQFRVVGVLREFYGADCGTVDAVMYGRSPKGPV